MARGGSRGQRARESAKRIQESRAGMCDALMHVKIKPLSPNPTKKELSQADKTAQAMKRIMYRNS